MGRIKGARNKNTIKRPQTSALSTTERIQLLANLVIERILEDQKNGNVLLRKINHGQQI